MAVPDFQSLMYPFLSIIQDGKVYSLDEMVKSLAQHFQLSSEDLKAKLRSGKQNLFRNRIGWVRSHLMKAGLIIYPERGHYKITPLGIEALAMAQQQYINLPFLRQFPLFQEWEATFGKGDVPKRFNGAHTVAEDINDKDTPEDVIDKALTAIHEALKFELRLMLKQKSAAFFEYFVLELLDKMGYGGVHEKNFEVVGGASDGGIDGIIYQDKLRLEKIYVQAKRWDSNKVRPNEIRDFIGALNLKGASKGVFMTTSEFTSEALQAAHQNPMNRVVLIDGNQLAELAIEHNVGIQTKKNFFLKELDMDFFENEE